MHKKFLMIAAYLGAFTVALGAFGAHGLKSIISDDAFSIFETAVRYQFYHVFSLITCGILFQFFHYKQIIWSGNFFIAGIILFCGSLYALIYFKSSGNESFNWLGAVTPIGGLCFILGWIFLAIGVSKKQV